MNKIVMAFLFCFISSIANAQNVIIDMQKPLKCSNPENVFNYFKDNFNEKPVWVGKSTTGSYITLLVNKEKNTWTMIEYDAALACVLGAGDSGSKPEI